MKATEENIRKVIFALWRNHPEGASTFHECATKGCKEGARDRLCNQCILKLFEKEEVRQGLRMLLMNIKYIRLQEEYLFSLLKEDE